MSHVLLAKTPADTVKRVYKFTLTVTERQCLKIPTGAFILSVQEQHGAIVLYALVQTKPETQSKEPRWIYMHGTGHEVDNRADTFIGTVQLLGGDIMFHIFEGTE